MAQYVEYTDYIEYTDGTDTYRNGPRNGFATDVELTALGFAGIENVDWENLELIAPEGLGIFRDGCRDLSYVIDEELTPLGFDGVEDTDWKELQEIKSD